MDSDSKRKPDCEMSSSDESTSDSEEDSINSEDDQIENKEIQVDFEACPILEQDTSGIRRLLRQLFLKEPIDLNELTETIINQKNIGSIIRQITDDPPEEDEEEDDDDEVFGLITFFDLSSSEIKAKNWYSSLLNYLSSHLIGDKKDKIEKILQDDAAKKVLIINLRFINIDWRIALPSFEQINRELESNSVDPDYYLMVCRILYPKRRFKDKKKTKQDREDVLFLNPEEEFFNECAEYRYEFDVSNQCDSGTMGGDWEEGDQEYCPCRRVLLFGKSSWTRANDMLKQNVPKN